MLQTPWIAFYEIYLNAPKPIPKKKLAMTFKTKLGKQIMVKLMIYKFNENKSSYFTPNFYSSISVLIMQIPKNIATDNAQLAFILSKPRSSKRQLFGIFFKKLLF